MVQAPVKYGKYNGEQGLQGCYIHRSWSSLGETENEVNK